MPALGCSYTRANVVADPLPTAIRLNAAENVKAHFRPVVDALRDLKGLVHSVVRRKHSVLHRFAAFDGKVRMQLDHGRTWCNGIGAVNLDFVIILAASEPGGSQNREEENEQSVGTGHGRS